MFALLRTAHLLSQQRAAQEATAAQAQQAQQSYNAARERNTAEVELYVTRARAILGAASDSLYLKRDGPVGQRFWADGSAQLAKLGTVDPEASNQQISDVLVGVRQQYRQAAIVFLGYVVADVNTRTAALKSTPAQHDSIVAAALAAVDPVYQTNILAPGDSIQRTLAPVLESFRAPAPIVAPAPPARRITHKSPRQ